MKLFVLNLAYNKEKTIQEVIEETKVQLPEADILVVNDDSTDKTKHILSKQAGIIPLHLPYNMRIGGAIWTGFNFFCRRDYEILVRIDGEADCVIGSRFITQEGYLSSLHRRGGIKLLNILTTFLLGQKITDNTSGFRAYNRKAISLLTEDYPFDYPEPIEVYLLHRNGLRVKEISAKMRGRSGGVSSTSLMNSYYYLIKVSRIILVNFIFGEKNPRRIRHIMDRHLFGFPLAFCTPGFD